MKEILLGNFSFNPKQHFQQMSPKCYTTHPVSVHKMLAAIRTSASTMRPSEVVGKCLLCDHDYWKLPHTYCWFCGQYGPQHKPIQGSTFLLPSYADFWMQCRHHLWADLDDSLLPGALMEMRACCPKGQHLDPIHAWESRRNCNGIGWKRWYSLTMAVMAEAERPLGVGVGVGADVLCDVLCYDEWCSKLSGTCFGTKLWYT